MKILVAVVRASRQLKNSRLTYGSRDRWNSEPKRYMPGLLFIALMACSPSSFSQTLTPAQPAASSATGKASATAPATSPVSRPLWVELTPLQQQALAPLASSWNTTISEAQKRKWLAISKNYDRLPLEGQATLNSRMNEWVALSPQQRAQARLNFGKTKELSRQLTPEEKKAKWEAYQALSPEEKQKLAAKGSPSATGAATAIKPVSPQKLATVPSQLNQPGANGEPRMTVLPVPASTPQAVPAGNAVDAPSLR